MRVFLADDQPKVRSALKLLLEQDPRMRVVGEAVEAEDLLSQLRAVCPDVVLLDWELPGLRAASSADCSTGSKARSKQPLLPTLRTLCPRLSVIALSGRPEARRAALSAGADVFVSKGDPPERLLAAMNSFCQN